MGGHNRNLATRVALASLAAAVATSCDDPVADPRPQLVVIVDTDAIVQGDLLLDPTLSEVAAVDTLRVDAIPTDGSNTAYDLRTFIAPDRSDWPLSFGVPASVVSADGRVRLRLRVFAGRLAQSGELAGEATLDPPPSLTIDRLIEVTPPKEGIKVVRVSLRQDCLGAPTFVPDPPVTCVDLTRSRAAPTEGVEPATQDSLETRSVLAGTWEHAGELPCTASPPSGVDAVCVPGGFDVMGNVSFVGLSEDYLDAQPFRAVMLSPYFMDRTEMTVGRFRQLLSEGKLPPDVVFPFATNPADPDVFDQEFCTWGGVDDSANDALPLNCVSDTTALAACIAAGGTLPSEAQWEHAASGRGRGQLYPWGDEVPECCTTSISRDAGTATPTECPDFGMEPVGSHPATEACGGRGDVSRDGVLDLAGSVTETLLDVPQPYDAECWRPPAGTGILRDPVCKADSLERSSRGGYWNSGRLTGATPFRNSATTGPSNGFRCVYPGGVAP